MRGKKRSRLPHPIHLLLVIPFVALLWTPFYNRQLPTLGGIPFFYWYQLAAILMGAAVVVVVYLLETRVTRTTEGTSEEIGSSGTPGDIL